MTLHGIDIASWQAGIDVAEVDADFVIVKVCGGTEYVNPYWKAWANEVLAAGKLLGLYHYANDFGWNPAEAEADFFLEFVREFEGKFIPVLDWEDEALENPVSWAKTWLDIVAAETGATPWFYAGALDVSSTDYSSISHYPLWKASYLYRYDGAGYVDDPDDIWGNGNWATMTAYQYTSTGYVDGYDGRLDLSVFYGTREDWLAMCGQEPDTRKNDYGIGYHAHVQNIGDMPTVYDGQTAGTTGRSLRLECLEFDSLPEGWSIRAKAHIQDEGWKLYGPGEPIGTKGKALRMEMIELEADKPAGDKRKLHYQVHVQDYGWLGDTLEGYATGCDGQSRRIEAIRVWAE